MFLVFIYIKGSQQGFTLINIYSIIYDDNLHVIIEFIPSLCWIFVVNWMNANAICVCDIEKLHLEFHLIHKLLKTKSFCFCLGFQVFLGVILILFIGPVICAKVYICIFNLMELLIREIKSGLEVHKFQRSKFVC